jgi:hypothetical protein
MKIVRFSSLLVVLALSACDAALSAKAQQDAEAEAAEASQAALKPAPADTTVVAKLDADANTDADAKPAVNAAATADIKATLEPAAFDLESVSFLVKKGKVKDAKQLEAQINDPKEKINNVDIDGDGKVDKIQVVEIRDEATGSIVFELRAIPSSTKDKDAAVVVATINFVPDKVTKKMTVKCVFTPIVVGHDTIVFEYFVPIEVNNDVIVVVDSSPFYGWAFTVSRPAYYGVFVYDVSPPSVIVIDGGCWPPGHCKGWKGHKYKGKGKGKHGGKHGGKHWH